MTSGWKRVAVFAAWLGLSVAGAQAQGYAAGPAGAARMPEPLRYTPGPAPNLVPGPMTPQMAPQGPPEGLQLNASHSSAFQFENYSTEAGVYAHFAGQTLRRYNVDRSVPIYFDADRNAAEDGFLSGPRLPVVGQAGEIDPKWNFSGKLTLGYLYGNQSWEVVGYYQPSAKSERTFSSNGQLFVPFAASNGATPPGFNGNNGLWTQADSVTTTFKTEMGGAEINYRVWNGGINLPDVMVGVRYNFLRESLTHFTNDDANTVNLAGLSDASLAASYTSQIRTKFYGVQFGSEYSVPLPTLLWKERFWFTGVGKAAFGINHVERNVTLTRGDGQVGFSENRNNYMFGQLYDVMFAIDIHVLEKARLRLGYQALWLFGTTTPSAQTQLDLSNPMSQDVGYKNVLYHGPQIELQFLF